jgi:uncharacterized membrane protein YdbT with pleckstrin-like domain
MSKLLPGENLVLQDHPHWITVVKSLVAPVILLVVIAIADFTLLGPGAVYVPKLRTVLSLGVLALVILWSIVVWVRWRSITYTLTDQRIKIESGVFGRQEKVIPIDRIQDCSTRQSVIGRMIGYGRVEIDAAGAQGAEVLDHLPQPGDFRDQVFVQSERRRGGGVPVGAPVPTMPANPSGV